MELVQECCPQYLRIGTWWMNLQTEELMEWRLKMELSQSYGVRENEFFRP